MKKKLCLILCFVLSLLCCFGAASAAAKDVITVEFYDVDESKYVMQSVTTVDLKYDGVILSSDVPAFIDRGRTLVPIYIIGNLLDADVEWNQEFRRAKIQTADKQIILTAGSNVAHVNGLRVPLPDDVPVALVNYEGSARTMVPWRFVAEQLGAKVEWDPDTYTVTLFWPDEIIEPIPEPDLGSEPEEEPDAELDQNPAPEPEPDPEQIPEPVIRTLSDVVVVLDAGHGGSDPGASYYNVIEKSVNLSVTKMVEEILLAQGVQVYMTRSDDSHVSLSERTTYANELGADLFVSLHSNAAELAPSASGIETYYYSGDAAGMELSSCIQTAVINSTGAKNRKTKTANFYVCKNTSMPAALVEMGFLTNAAECEKLESSEYQRQLAEGIAAGIIAYAETLIE